MGLFRRKKPKHRELSHMDETAAEQQEGSGEGREALGICEQLIAASRELDETKREYRQATDYLTDIQKLEELPAEEMEPIRETASNILGLNQMQEEISHKKKRMSDAQFAQMEQMEKELPDDIRRLKANESYQSMVKRDIDNLEGEKSEWSYYLESLIREQKLLKIVLWVVLGIFFAGVCALLYLQYELYWDTTLWLLLLSTGAALGGGFCILRMQSNRTELSKSHASINRAIILLNQMKAKYVNVTNAVDYACEKFHVRNSMELHYLWEQYLEAVREREAANKANEDLEYYSRKLVRILRSYQLYDAAIWVSQAAALVDKKEMVEVKHFLIVRRQKLRARIEQQVGEIKALRKQLILLAAERQEYAREIHDVLTAIDQICGV